MTLTSTSDELRKAASEARHTVVAIVESSPGIHVDKVYDKVASDAPRWQEPAVRTAIWDLIAEHQMIVRRGNLLYPPGG